MEVIMICLFAVMMVFFVQYEEIDGDDEGFEKFPRHVYERDGLNPVFEIGITFDIKFKFKQPIVNHDINTGLKLYFKKDDKVRVRVACKGDNCEFLIYSHKVLGTHSFQIRKMNLNMISVEVWIIILELQS